MRVRADIPSTPWEAPLHASSTPPPNAPWEFACKPGGSRRAGGARIRSVARRQGIRARPEEVVPALPARPWQPASRAADYPPRCCQLWGSAAASHKHREGARRKAQMAGTAAAPGTGACSRGATHPGLRGASRGAPAPSGNPFPIYRARVASAAVEPLHPAIAGPPSQAHVVPQEASRVQGRLLHGVHGVWTVSQGPAVPAPACPTRPGGQP